MAPSSPQPISITLFGTGGTGKSSLTLSLVRAAFSPHYDPTIEDSYSVTRKVDGVEYPITITDTAGQEEYRGLWAHEALQSDGFLFVYDITRKETLDQLEWFDGIVKVEAECRKERAESAARMRALGAALGDLPGQSKSPSKSRSRRGTGVSTGRSRRGTGATAPPMPMNKPIKIVAGNKVDLAAEREVSAREGLEWARSHGCGFMETSARDQINVEETFGLIVRRVVEARREEEQRIMEEEYVREQARRAEEKAGKYAIGRGIDDWQGKIDRRATVDWTKNQKQAQWPMTNRHIQLQSPPRRDRKDRNRDKDRPREREGETREERQARKERQRDRERDREEIERERRLKRRQSESGINLRHAPTAPLSPLGADGMEKRMRLPGPKGEIGPTTRRGWAWLRCW